MTDRKDKSSRIVRFAQTEADQMLLEAIDQALNTESYTSFSDLCKQALRSLLTASTAPSPALLPLQQQVIALQLQVAKLEGMAQVWQSCPIGHLEQQVGQLGDRLGQLESGLLVHTADSPSDNDIEAAKAIEADPLLSRLAPLLEDF